MSLVFINGIVVPKRAGYFSAMVFRGVQNLGKYQVVISNQSI